MTKDFIFSLARTPPMTMTDLQFKAQKYMNRVYALTTKGIDGKQKIDDLDESQNKKINKKRITPLVQRVKR